MKGVPNCYNEFVFVGEVTDMQREQLYREKLTSNKKTFNIIKFGIKINENETLYVHMKGFTNDELKIHKYDYKAKKYEDCGLVKWENRFDLEKNVTYKQSVRLDNGKVERLTPFDACIKIRDGYLKDGDIVEVEGYINYFKSQDNSVETGFEISSIKKSNTSERGARFVQEIIFGKIDNNNLITNIATYKEGFRYIYEIDDNIKQQLEQLNLQLLNSIQVCGNIKPYIKIDNIDGNQVIEEQLKYHFNIDGIKEETIKTNKYKKEMFKR